MSIKAIRVDRAGLGISITILGGLCFAIQDAGIKWLSAEIAVLQILFLRSLSLDLGRELDEPQLLALNDAPMGVCVDWLNDVWLNDA